MKLYTFKGFWGQNTEGVLRMGKFLKLTVGNWYQETKQIASVKRWGFSFVVRCTLSVEKP